MDFIIKCDVFNRLVQITNKIRLTRTPEMKELLSCVRLEYKNNKYYAIATNQDVAAIQYLGETDESDQAIHIINDERIVRQSEIEIMYDSSFVISAVPELGVATMRTLMGWQFEGNCCKFFDQTPLDNWQSWFPDSEVKKNKGIMYWDSDHVAALSLSSPSGKLYFPEFIDVDKPLVIRDRLDDTWVGLFIPKPEPTEPSIKKGAEIPSWV